MVSNCIRNVDLKLIFGSLFKKYKEQLQNYAEISYIKIY
jgi:hypothetical protein